MSIDVAGIQQYLGKENLDGWLMYDFQGSNPIAMDLAPFSGIVSRRWFLLIPKKGSPVLLAHKIEESSVKNDFAENRYYSGWKMLDEELKQLLSGCKRVAMEYSPNNDIPYVSKVDAGTIEKIRSFGVEIISSANLVQHFQARWSPKQFESHKVAANYLVAFMQELFEEVGEKIAAGEKLTEYQLQKRILGSFKNYGMVWEHEPIVSFGPNAALPHYAPSENEFAQITEGNILLLDIFCRQSGDHTISADITWTAYVGKEPIPPKMLEVFNIVTAARDAGVEFIDKNLSAGNVISGWQVDDAVRNVIEKAGYGEYFTHRTGHSLGTLIHSNGVNIDNFETRDKRNLEPGVGFTIEPGIYLPGEFGIRSEINCFIGEKGLEVTTQPLQTELKALL